MPKNLFDLFDDKLKSEKDLIASETTTLDSISSVEEEQDMVIEKLKRLETTELKVDYSNFSNFVFFNSALDYFNITGEKILNDFPFDRSSNDIEKFEADLDGYQRYVLSQWPKYAGHLRFNTAVSSSFIKIEDVGVENGVAKTGLLSPGTGSISLETWINPGQSLTGSNTVQILTQKISGSDGYTLFLSGTNITFSVKSGSVTNEVSSPYSIGNVTYIAAILDRSSSTGSLIIVTGSSGQFPITAATSSLTITGPINLGGAPFYIASGTLPGKVTSFYSGSIDDIRIWNKPLSSAIVSSSFNIKHYAQKNLIASYRFNESGSYQDIRENSIVLDNSGNKLNGVINNYYNNLRGSGSLLEKEYPDNILSFTSPEVSSYILENQLSGSDFDRNNPNKITEMIPDAFFIMEDFKNTEVLKNFLYVMARHFDFIKLHIDQFINIFRVNYGDYNQTPDIMLPIVAKHFGWDFAASFSQYDTNQYLFGRNVLNNTQNNNNSDVSLYEIKNKFWKRILINLMYLYKTKGTKESVKSLLRLYGVNDNLIKIKEFGHSSEVSLGTQRIKSEKSVAALGFGSGSLTGSVFISGSFQPLQSIGNDFSIETRFRFPLTSSIGIQSTIATGSLWKLVSSGSKFIRLRYEKDSLGSNTGSFILHTSDLGLSLTASNLPIFNNKWHNVTIVKNSSTGSLSIDVKLLDDKQVVYSFSTRSLNAVGYITGSSLSFDTISLGNVDNLKSEFWAQEFRLWKKPLTEIEMTDHTLNYQSYGTDSNDNSKLLVHWRLNENMMTSIAGALTGVLDVSLNNIHATGSGFYTSINPYKKFLNEYNYIAPIDFGWNEDKIRTINSTDIKKSDSINDTNFVSVEYNLIDALNEDITQLLSSLDILDNSIGLPVNKYRSSYDDLDKIRQDYFKRLQGRLNFRLFSDLLEFFDRTFIDMIKKLMPARSTFLGDEFVVESHMLERPKVVYERRNKQHGTIIIDGTIDLLERFGE